MCNQNFLRSRPSMMRSHRPSEYTLYISRVLVVISLVHMNWGLKCTKLWSYAFGRPSVVNLSLFTFSPFPQKPLNGIRKKLYMKQVLNVFYRVCVFGLIEKQRWPSWPLICWDIFHLSSSTAERNLTKLDWKQLLNILYYIAEMLLNVLLNGFKLHQFQPMLFFSGWLENKYGRFGLIGKHI